MRLDNISNIRSSVSGLENLTDKNRNQKNKLKETCQEFESIFVNEMMKAMRKTINKTGLVDGGQAENIFQSMLDEEYAREISQNGTLGLSDMLFNQLGQNL
ncbi:MAG: rod-binding protein [Candidatus Muiribacteriota bacterium]|jgi:flagellar protein FlgJ